MPNKLKPCPFWARLKENFNSFGDTWTSPRGVASEAILRQADLAFESRAIHAGYYCQEARIVRPEHFVKCEKVASGEPYRQAFAEYFQQRGTAPAGQF